MTSTPAPPTDWAKEVRNQYDPVRTLGKGGFASVMLAKHKESKEFVAMKVVGPTGSDISNNNNSNNAADWKVYAYRELDILRELNHDNIIKVKHVWEEDEEEKENSKNNHPMVIALQYVKGPTVQDLLLHRGALNATEFGRVVIAQLVDALSYLHSRAVIHRDVKPDNVIVSGALSSQNEIWEEDTAKTNHDWQALRKKWHVTLIDFGFARALTPEDVEKPSVQIRKENMDASYSVRNLSAAADNTNDMDRSRRLSISSQKSSMDLSSSTTRRNKSRRSSAKLDSSSGSATLNRSFSRKFHRKMSALGNRHYAAPEILNVERKHGGISTTSSSTTKNTAHSSNLTETVSEFVSEYGLLVDAYSLGHTIRYMMTGVPPHMSVEEKIASKKTLLYKLGKMFQSKAKQATKPSKRHVLESDLPGEVQRLISKLTERLESNRTSVRAARRYPWIDDVLPQSATTMGSTTKAQEISFLSMAIHKKNETMNMQPQEEGPLTVTPKQ